jgi:hypothetical protein
MEAWDEAGGMATGPENAEVSQRIEPLELAAIFR